MTALAVPSTNDHKSRLQYEAGALSLVLIRNLAERLTAEDCPTPDLHKGLELTAKIMGIKDNERVDNLPTIVWNITGGNVTVDMKPAVVVPQPITIDQDMPEVTDVQAKEPQATKTPEEALASTFTFATLMGNLDE